MAKLKTIEDYGREVYSYASNPTELARVGVQMAAQYGFMTGQYIQLKRKQAEHYVNNCHGADGKKVSDKLIEAKWTLTEEGVEHLRMKKEMKALEQMMIAVRTNTFTANQESKSQY